MTTHASGATGAPLDPGTAAAAPAPMPTLETARLRLRPFHEGDGPAVERLAGAREIADTTLTVPHPYPEGGGALWIATHQPAWEAGKGLTLAVTLRDGPDVPVAAVGLGINSQHAYAELGYWVGVPHWGRGYATEASRALLDHGFDALGLHRVQARHLTRNPASGRVMRKLGMRLEGVHRGALRKWGVSEDVAMYAVLADEWRTLRQRAERVGSAVVVRPATPADADAVLAVSLEGQAMHADALSGTFRPADAALLRPVVEARLAAGGGDDRLAFVAVVDGEVAGYVHAEIERRDASPFKTGGARVYVHQLGVLDAHRGAGLGRRLMEAVHEAAAARGVTEVALHVYSFNAGARALYDRLGYRPLQELLVLDGDASRPGRG